MSDDFPSAAGGDATVQGCNSAAEGGAAGQADFAPGGKGGDARVRGDWSRAFGGRGGRGGTCPGMPGQDVVVEGNDQTIIGGDGGEAGQIDGRGGRGAPIDLRRAGLEDVQLPDGRWLSGFGRGGNGGHSPQYEARLMVIEEIVGHGVTMEVSSCRELEHRDEALFLKGLNERLAADAHGWRVRIVARCFRFDDL